MQSLTVFGPNLRDQSKGSFVVHAADCSDCRKLKGEEAWTEEFYCVSQIVFDVYPPEDFDYDPKIEYNDYRSDFHLAPCVKLPETDVR